MYKHKLRKKVFEKGQWRTKIVHTDAELGSGILDKNGKEIFEGDKIKVNVDAISENILPQVIADIDELRIQPPQDGLTTVEYQYGEFVLMWDVDGGSTYISLGSVEIVHANGCLEVVGHAGD